jgi:hypothetical protein
MKATEVETKEDYILYLQSVIDDKDKNSIRNGVSIAVSRVLIVTAPNTHRMLQRLCEKLR